MKRKAVILLGLWMAITLAVVSQEQHSSQLQHRTVNQSTLVGVGKSFLNDSYLSPLRYNGTGISLLHERLKGTSLLGGKMLLQQQFLIQTALTKNPSASASEYYGDLSYQLTGYYPLLLNSNLRIYGGGGWEVSLGGIYNQRNTNNPGSLKVATNLHLAAMALYNWKIFTFRWQLSTPFAGMFFSPEYGHSYYEIFTLGNNKGTVHFGSFHNQQALRSNFSVDIPIQKVTLRAAYMANYYRTEVNHLVTRIASNQFMIGLALETLNFGGKNTRQHPSLQSVYY